MNRGEIWWASMGAPDKSEPGYKRPVLIMQSNDFNRSLIHTVVCVAVTSNLNLVKAPGNVEVRKRETGLPKDSVINVSQIVTLDKSHLVERVSMLPNRILAKVERGIMKVLSVRSMEE